MNTVIDSVQKEEEGESGARGVLCLAKTKSPFGINSIKKRM